MNSALIADQTRSRQIMGTKKPEISQSRALIAKQSASRPRDGANRKTSKDWLCFWLDAARTTLAANALYAMVDGWRGETMNDEAQKTLALPDQSVLGEMFHKQGS